MKKSILLNALLALTMLMVVSCSDDENGPGAGQEVEPRITSFRIVSPIEATGNINETDRTVQVNVPADEDVSTAEVAVEVPEGATVVPASGSEVDFTNPVTFTVTGTDASGNPETREYTVTLNRTAVVAFVGNASEIGGLEDDAQAAANWMQETYGEEFVYLSADEINADALANLKVIFFYELNAEEEIDLGAMGSESVSTAISNFVRDGGQLLLAGDAADYIFDINRVPAAYDWTENPGVVGVEGDKAPDDHWGIGVNPETTISDQTGHPLFEGIINADNNVLLNNAPTREVRLTWWNVGPAGAECCGEPEMVTNFENQLKATKLGSLPNVSDYFGFAAVEFERTDLDTHADLSPDVPGDFRGHIIMLANTIIGYEWETQDGSPNDNHENIEQLTQNAIEYLRGLYDAQ